jgi:hypothetical protein
MSSHNYFSIGKMQPFFFISKANSLKAGATQMHMTYTREKHTARSRTRKESTKIYKAINIENGINRV